MREPGPGGVIRRARPVALAAAVLALPVWLLCHSGDAGFGPVRFLFNGRAFAERPLVVGGALDQGSLQKELFLFVYSLVLLTPFLALARWISRASVPVALILLVHPLSILVIYTYDVCRYVLHKGITPMRLLALLFALIGTLLLSLLAAWTGGWLTSGRRNRPVRSAGF